MANSDRKELMKTLWAVFLVFCIIATALALFISAENVRTDNGRSATHGIITGVVKDADTDKPISNALMTLKYHELVRTDFTDSKGMYKFDNVPMCFCLKNISAAKSGYKSQYKMVGVYKVTWVNFSLEPTQDSNESMYGVITGVVKDNKTAEPISKALVTLEYHDIVRKQFTDTNGEYKFDNVPMCFCLKDVTAAKDGYEKEQQSVPVSEITYVNFSLEPIEDKEDPDDPEDPEEPENPEEPDEPDGPEDPEEPNDPDEPDEPEDKHSMYGILKGVVVDASTDKPITDVLMTLKYHDVVRKQYTDPNGQYSFDNVPICFCLKDISASKDGYKTQQQLVPVSDVTHVNFSLEKDESGKDGGTEPITNSGEDVTDDKAGSIGAPNEARDLQAVYLGLASISVILIIICLCILLYRSYRKRA